MEKHVARGPYYCCAVLDGNKPTCMLLFQRRGLDSNPLKYPREYGKGAFPLRRALALFQGSLLPAAQLAPRMVNGAPLLK